jgi:hypothetical protein
MPTSTSLAWPQNGDLVELSLRYIFIRLLSRNEEQTNALQGLDLVKYYLPYMSSEDGDSIYRNVLRLGSQEDPRLLESWVISWIDDGEMEEGTKGRIKLRLLAEVLGECERAVTEKHVGAIALSQEWNKFTTSLTENKVLGADRIAFKVRRDIGKDAYVFRKAKYERSQATSRTNRGCLDVTSAVLARSVTVASTATANTAHLPNDPEHMLFDALTRARQDGLTDDAQRDIISRSIQNRDPSPLRDMFKDMLEARRRIEVAEGSTSQASLVANTGIGTQDSTLSKRSETGNRSFLPDPRNHPASSKRQRFLQRLAVLRPSETAALPNPSIGSRSTVSSDVHSKSGR